MKWFLILWAGPIALLGSWYGLSYYDMSFGFFMLTRQAHDLVFHIYGHILGIPPESLPPLRHEHRLGGTAGIVVHQPSTVFDWPLTP